MKLMKKGDAVRMGTWVPMVLAPFLCLYLVEGWIQAPWTLAPQIQIINAFFYLSLLLLALAATGRLRWAVTVTVLLAYVVGLANYAVVSFRGTPILPWDLLSAKTAMQVRSGYRLPTGTAFWLISGAAVAAVAAAQFARARARGWKRRLAAAGAGLVLLAVFTGAVQNTEFTRLFGFNHTLFTQSYLYRCNGFAASFLGNLRFLDVDPPEGYTDARMEALEQQLTGTVPEPGGTEELPNLIVIMNETFSDPSVLSDLPVSEEVTPFFNSLKENTIRGDLYVSIIGGNTATTEFEFLTGHSMAFLPAGSVAFQQYIHEDITALPASLKQLGYRTIGMHPYYPGGWNRDDVYPRLGFERNYFLQHFQNAQLLRGYVTDQSLYEAIIRESKFKPEGTPLFTFAVTMQNHGGYGGTHPEFIPQIRWTAPSEPSSDLEQYLSLLRVSDQALELLIGHFEQEEEPTVILFFGDHQPHDPVVSSLLPGMADSPLEGVHPDRYRVPYLIWANYDIEEQQNLDTSPNFLSSLLLETAGVPDTPYGSFLNGLRAQVPVMTAEFYRDPDGTFHRYPGTGGELAAAFRDYEALQYNHLFDRDNTRSRLFVPRAKSELTARYFSPPLR